MKPEAQHNAPSFSGSGTGVRLGRGEVATQAA